MSVEKVEKVKETKAKDVMTKNVATIDGGATVADAVRRMRQLKVSSLLVNRRTHDDAWGIVTRKDVVGKVIAPGKDPAQVKVFDIMSKPLITVSPGLSLKYCARLMDHANIRRAPVFDGKEVVGILSNTDIFNALEV